MKLYSPQGPRSKVGHYKKGTRCAVRDLPTRRRRDGREGEQRSLGVLYKTQPIQDNQAPLRKRTMDLVLYRVVSRVTVDLVLYRMVSRLLWI